MPNSFLKRFLKIGKSCAYCGREIPESRTVCEDCQKDEIKYANRSPFDGSLLYVFDYEGVVRLLLHRFKYQDQPYCAYFIAQKMAEYLSDFELHADFITFVPIHKNRRKQRGYDQSELIAENLSKLTDIPFSKTLRRVKDTVPQYRLSANERQTNLRSAFELLENAQIDGKTFLLIDDIYTTGATTGECMQLLSGAGGSAVPFAFSKDPYKSVR